MQTPKTLSRVFDPKTGIETIAFLLPEDRYTVFGYFLGYHDKEQAIGGLCAHILGRGADEDRVLSWGAQQLPDDVEIRIKFGPPWWWKEHYQYTNPIRFPVCGHVVHLPKDARPGMILQCEICHSGNDSQDGTAGQGPTRVV